jgi:hypothetical protein
MATIDTLLDQELKDEKTANAAIAEPTGTTLEVDPPCCTPPGPDPGPDQ